MNTVAYMQGYMHKEAGTKWNNLRDMAKHVITKKPQYSVAAGAGLVAAPFVYNSTKDAVSDAQDRIGGMKDSYDDFKEDVKNDFPRYKDNIESFENADSIEGLQEALQNTGRKVSKDIASRSQGRPVVDMEDVGNRLQESSGKVADVLAKFFSNSKVQGTTLGGASGAAIGGGASALKDVLQGKDVDKTRTILAALLGAGVGAGTGYAMSS